MTDQQGERVHAIRMLESVGPSAAERQDRSPIRTKGGRDHWLQQRLADLGYDPGAIDGGFDPQSGSALGNFADDVGVETTDERALARALFRATRVPTAEVGPEAAWAWPVPGVSPSAITSPVCWRNGRHHEGIDIAAPGGQAVGATRAGRVLHAGWNAGGFGNLVVIGHGEVARHGLVHSYYAHLTAELRVRVGQSVAQNELIARVDNSGSSYGNHLHFEVHGHAGQGRPFTGTPIDPCQFLSGC